MSDDTRDMRFFPTPWALTRWLFRTVSMTGLILEPCAGAGDIVTTAGTCMGNRAWVTSDLDPRWVAADMHPHVDYTADARGTALYDAIRRDHGPIDHIVTNPAFDHAEEIVDRALHEAQNLVAMYLRLSFLEPKKTGGHAEWLRRHPPTTIMPCPRVAHRRSPKTGEWSTDTMACAWFLWDNKILTPNALELPPWIFPDAQVFQELHDETPAYRAYVDQLIPGDVPQ